MSDAAETPTKSSVIRDVNSDHGFATLTLNRPDSLTSLSNDLLESLADAIESVAEDDSARAVIITGSGRAFCAGADTDEMTGGEGEGPHKPGPGSPESLRRGFKLAQKEILGIYEMEKPVIAAINGSAIGAGFDLACTSRHPYRFQLGPTYGCIRPRRVISRIRWNVAVPAACQAPQKPPS